MVHMPSHIYQRVGRYADAERCNERAVAADEDYIHQCRAQGLYPMAYYPHNIHFIWFAATMEGRSAAAIAAARKVAAQVSDSALAALPLLAGFRVVPWYALTRFGHWDEMLAEPAPPRSNLYLTGTWTYARGLALLGKGRRDDAARALDHAAPIAADTSLRFTLFSPNTAQSILAVAPEVLAGELAGARGDRDAAVHHLERAVLLEDALTYTEPEEWHYPPRQALGAALLAAGRAREAEAVYWQDLKKHPENGWSLWARRGADRAGRSPEAPATHVREVLLEILPVDGLGFARAAGGEQRGAQRLPRRVVPLLGLRVRERVLQEHRPLEVMDGRVAVTARAGQLAGQHLGRHRQDGLRCVGREQRERRLVSAAIVRSVSSARAASSRRPLPSSARPRA